MAPPHALRYPPIALETGAAMHIRHEVAVQPVVEELFRTLQLLREHDSKLGLAVWAVYSLVQEREPLKLGIRQATQIDVSQAFTTWMVEVIAADIVELVPD